MFCLKGIICSANIKDKQVRQVVLPGRGTLGVDRIANKAVSDHANNGDLIPGYRPGRFLAGCLR